MEKKMVYALVCVNEEGSIVSVSLHNTQDEAHKKMQQEYDCEMTGMVDICPTDDEDDIDDFVEDAFIGDMTAHINYGSDMRYEWTIVRTKEA